ncbi:MAG: 50S ribosomal protein L33 [Gammaproteobacteria bacterium]
MGDRIIVKLVSQGKKENGERTGYFKMAQISTKPKLGAKREKLQKKIFDPRAYNEETGKCGMHVMAVEDKKLK